MATPPLNAIRNWPPVAALTFDKTKVSVSCARTGMYTVHYMIYSTVKNDWTPRIDFSNNALTYRRYANHKARKHLYLLYSSGQRHL